MSAVVKLEHRSVEVPRACAHKIDDDGRLTLMTAAYNNRVVAVFQRWEYFVITPERGANGRFIKKG